MIKSNKTKSSNLKPKKVFTNVLLLSLFAGVTAMFVGQLASANNTTAESTIKVKNSTANLKDTTQIKGASDLKPHTLTGHITKTLEQFSLTTNDGLQYHVYDPHRVLDKLAKKKNIHNSLYEMDGVNIKALISGVGKYGHMGFYKRQITILQLADK